MGTFLNEILFTYLLAVIFKIKSISIVLRNFQKYSSNDFHTCRTC